MLELIPNNKLTSAQPVEFTAEFFTHEMLIRYHVSLDLGLFMEEDYPRKILQEELTINDDLIFRRNEELIFKNKKTIKNYLTDSADSNWDSIGGIARDSLNSEELFLTNGFKLIYAPSLVKIVTEWFANQFMVIYRADSMQLIKRFIDPQKKAVYVERTTDKAAKLFGINSNAVGYVVNEDETESKLYSIFQNIKVKKVMRLLQRYLNPMVQFVLSICFRW